MSIALQLFFFLPLPDDVFFSPGLITWTIPKNISPLLIGAKIIQSSSYHFGVDIRNMTNEQILASRYDITDGVDAITIKIPIGADGGHYKVRANQSICVLFNLGVARILSCMYFIEFQFYCFIMDGDLVG